MQMTAIWRQEEEFPPEALRRLSIVRGLDMVSIADGSSGTWGIP